MLVRRPQERAGLADNEVHGLGVALDRRKDPIFQRDRGQG